jgi:SAM-dependent methyltransferase
LAPSFAIWTWFRSDFKGGGDKVAKRGHRGTANNIVQMSDQYSRDFFESHKTESDPSAQVIIPIILSLFSIKSVVDVGCGVGAWLSTFESHGVTDYLGIDGAWVPNDMLRIPKDRFLAVDLKAISDIGQFDMAISLEVAEHLPENCADQFVNALVRAAPIVVFSAAIPYQGGIAHINEQLQSYWKEKFVRHGYVAVDCIRPQVYQRSDVSFWYRQNVIVYCEPQLCPRGYTPVKTDYEIDRVDPTYMAWMHKITDARSRMLIAQSQTGRVAWKNLKNAVMRKLGSLFSRKSV